MKEKRKIINIDEELCDGCGQCALACAEGAIEVVDGKARLISENYCDGLAACLGECPQGALKIVEREAESFDPEAVEHHLQQDLQSPVSSLHSPVQETLPCGCPSTHVQIFVSPCTAANHPSSLTNADSVLTNADSALTHWPVQIKLVPPSAPFLKNADLLVAADCTPVAYPDFHSRFLKGKAVLIGCPKFDETQEYVNKFAEIFKTAGIKSVTVLTMEVPCCSKLPVIVSQGMALSGKKVPMETVVISARGKVLSKEKTK